MKTLIIAGGSGFLGQVLENYFVQKGFKVIILTRQPDKENEVYWNATELGKWTIILENADILINLTGKSVDCRYNEKNKKLIYDSRINSTNILGLAINLCNNPPKLWMNASTATIYRGSYDMEMSEDNGEVGNDFSMNIAKSWENTFYSITNPKTRKIALRTAIVLGKNGGAFKPLKILTKLGLGGKQGHGNQKVSWIHELDFAKAVEFLINNKSLNGNFNICVPKPTDNKTLMISLQKALGISFGIPQSKALLNLGAKIVGTETELILKSRNVIPERLLNEGFKFNYPDIKIALQSLTK